MSRNASIELAWADGTYPFRLALSQIEELQEKTDCGPYELHSRILNGKWRVRDLRETIRCGLIGGGMEPSKASTLVQRYADNRPLVESIRPALAILGAALLGAPDGEQPGKAERRKARKAATASPMENSPSPRTTETEQP